MATKPINTNAIQKATGKSWQYWVKFLNGINAGELKHTEIANKVHEHGAPGWWAQTITVAYEQHIGRRKPGQRNDGKFNVSASRTVSGDIDQALKKWSALVNDSKSFNGANIIRAPKTTKSDQWRYWNCGLDDGSRLTVSMYYKGDDKSSIGLGHEGIDSATKAEQWRTFWKNLLAKLS